jgi:hypothetical protein
VRDRLITLEISEAIESGGRTFLYHLRLDDTPLVANQMLTLPQSDHIRDIGEAYGALFLTSGPAQAAILVNAQLKAMGDVLFATWLEPHWPKVAVNPGDRRILIIASTIPEVLNLPWELLRPPDREDICTDTGWGIRRMPWLNRRPATTGLTAGPLRVLFCRMLPARRAVGTRLRTRGRIAIRRGWTKHTARHRDLGHVRRVDGPSRKV